MTLETFSIGKCTVCGKRTVIPTAHVEIWTCEHCGHHYIMEKKAKIVNSEHDDKVDDFHWARINYKAYGDATDNLNYQGNPMPKFDDLPDKIKRAWQRSALAVQQESVAYVFSGKAKK